MQSPLSSPNVRKETIWTNSAFFNDSCLCRYVYLHNDPVNRVQRAHLIQLWSSINWAVVIIIYTCIYTSAKYCCALYKKSTLLKVDLFFIVEPNTKILQSRTHHFYLHAIVFCFRYILQYKCPKPQYIFPTNKFSNFYWNKNAFWVFSVNLICNT